MADLVKVVPDTKTLVFQVGGFPSMYESFQRLTLIQLSHFVEWFTGKALDSIWTKVNHTGGDTSAMVDAIDEGFAVKTDSTDDAATSIKFNDKRHYDPNGCICILVARRVSGNYQFHAGLAGDNNQFSDDAITVTNESPNTFYGLRTSIGGTSTVDFSDVNIDLNFHTHKMELDGTDAKLTIDGVLKVTKTDNIPTAKLQPTFTCRSFINDVVKECRIRYLEVFNTGVPILSSIYERLSALTQVMNQRFYDSFVGAVINERWNEHQQVGTATFAMVDAIDEGFSIDVSTGAADNSFIGFNLIRPFNPDSCFQIAVTKRVDAGTAMVVGFSDNNNVTTGGQFAVWTDDTNKTFKEISVSGPSTSSTTPSDIPIDTLFHTCKIELTSTSVIGILDGVLKVTHTAEDLTTKQQPVFGCLARATGGKECRIRSLETYNKLTAEAVFPSIYEMFNKLTEIAKAHFWDWFDGNGLHNRWTTFDFQGTGIYSMVDAIDEGFQIQTGTANNDNSNLTFNDKRQFDSENCVFIAVVRSVDSALRRHAVGISDSKGIPSGTNDIAVISDDTTTSAFKFIRTQDGSAGTSTDTDVSRDEIFHTYIGDMSASDGKFFIDGILKVTQTTNLPVGKCQPVFLGVTRTTAAKQHRIRYFEIKNKR